MTLTPLPTSADIVHGTAAGFVAYWEGFIAEAAWDVNAYRNGFGSDTMGAAQIPVKKGSVTTRDDALANLAARLVEYETGAMKQLGAALYAKLGLATKVAVLDMCYNYGSIPASVLSAFLNDSIHVARAIRNHESDNATINRDRRAAEAALVIFDGGQLQ